MRGLCRLAHGLRPTAHRQPRTSWPGYLSLIRFESASRFGLGVIHSHPSGGKRLRESDNTGQHGHRLPTVPLAKTGIALTPPRGAYVVSLTGYALPLAASPALAGRVIFLSFDLKALRALGWGSFTHIPPGANPSGNPTNRSNTPNTCGLSTTENRHQGRRARITIPAIFTPSIRARRPPKQFETIPQTCRATPDVSRGGFFQILFAADP